MNNRFPNRRWCIINSGDATNVNYNQVLQNTAATLRYSIDGSKTFVKYNITEYPVIQGYDQSGNVQYGDNVDSAGNTYNMYYEQEKTYYPLYSPEGDRSTVTGSGFHWTDVQPLNLTGSGIAYASGVTAGRPDIFSSALTVSGKTEFNHPEILGILGTEDWTQTGLI